jgi:hypothetical protein
VDYAQFLGKVFIPELPAPPEALLPLCLQRGSSSDPTRPALQLHFGEFGKCHSSWRMLQIARAIVLNYNLSISYLILIILQEPLFLREMIKYIHSSCIE